jgi:twitching motility two-component system response regulator PilH
MIVEATTEDPNHLSQILSKAGCTVRFARSGAAALELLKTYQPDMVLMDINLPELDGFATARKMNREPATRAIPVVFITGNDQREDRIFAQMMGAKGYLTKPLQDQKLLQCVSALCASPA